MSARKIQAMYERFGRYGVGACRDCCHFVTGRYHDKILRKCDVYGLTHSEATDWAGKYAACGQFNKPYKGGPIIELLKYGPRRQNNSPVDGQMDMFGGDAACP